MGGGSTSRGAQRTGDPCQQKHVADGGAGGVLVFTLKTHLAGISHNSNTSNPSLKSGSPTVTRLQLGFELK